MSDVSTTEQDILSQPTVWQQTIGLLEAGNLRSVWGTGTTDVIVTGCGSTHYLAMSAAELLRAVPGLRVRATPASELMAHASPRFAAPSSTLLLAISRSGATSETVAAVEEFRRHGGGRVVAVTTVADCPLVDQADASLVLPTASEVSVAQTRSFTSMLLAVQALAAVLGGHDLAVLRQLPQYASDLLERTRESSRALASDRGIESFYFLGSGALFGVASEAMLKLTEMSLTQSEAYHTLEFRHGPMSMCEPSVAVLGLITPERASIERAVIDHVSGLGARTLTLGPGESVTIPPSLPAWTRPVLYLLPLQLLALERALAKGLDPDQPRHLTAVIHLDPLSESA
ncbi:MAG TPA: SIS domain-containing protein [Actinomycetes bacterium]|nr:SIS domain-containing protein [Actinomycetes bacterium]